MIFSWNFIFEKTGECFLTHMHFVFDITYHDRDRSSTSRALLGLTVLDNLVCSQSHITTVTSYLTIVTMLTINHHDRDSLWGRFWGAHDRSSRSWPYPSSSWPSKNFGFLIGLSLVYFWLFWGFCLALEALHNELILHFL